MKHKTHLIAAFILLAIGIFFLLRNPSGSNSPPEQRPDIAPPNGNSNGHDPDPVTVKPVKTKALRYKAPPGRVLEYDVSMVSTVRLVVDLKLQPGQAPAETTVTMRLAGILECAGYESPRKDRLLVGCQFKEVSFKSEPISLDPTTARLFSAQFQEEFFIFLTRRGKIESFHHSPKVKFEIQGMEKALMLNGRIILPEKRGPNWEEREEDQTGPFLANYNELSDGKALDKMQISKEKAYYESVSVQSISGGEDQGGSMMAYPEGKTDAIFILQDGYLNRVNQNETIEILGEGFGTGTKVTTKTHFRFLRTFYDDDRKKKSIQDMERILAKLESSGVRGGAAEKRNQEAKAISRLEREAEGHTVDEIIATLRHLIESGKGQGRENYDALRVLAALLALDDARVEKIQALLQSGDNVDLLRKLTNALGGAGTPAAQKVLVETIADMNIHPLVRDSALASFAAPMTPSPEAEEAMLGLVNPGNNDELDIGVNSLNILGIMAKRLGTLDPERATGIVGQILEKEEDFRAANKSKTFLTALANSKHPDAYDSIVPYTKSSDPDIRATAVAAMGRMPQAEANSFLLNAMSDKSSLVKISAIQASGSRPANSGLAGGLTKLLLKDGNPEVRREALSYFSSKLWSDPSLKNLLQKVANSDPDPEIRNEAQEALNSQ